MMKHNHTPGILAWALLAALALATPAAAAPGPGAAPRTAPVLLSPQSGDGHGGYMNGDTQGLFHPDQPVTRAELAQMLYAVVADVPYSLPAFSDVPGDAWYAPAAGTAAGLGLLRGQDGAFRPNDPATRAECAAALSLLLPFDCETSAPFSDVEPGHWSYTEISRAAGRGLLRGDASGTFRPDDVLLRCEAAAVFNRLLGRSADLQAIAQLPPFPFFPDVPETHWAYGDIVEATVSHTFAADPTGAERWTQADVEQAVPPAPALADGPQRMDGHLYWAVNGTFARGCSIGGLYFDENGWYTTGSAQLDAKLNAIVDELTCDSMTRDEKLRALYNYCRDNFTYLKRPLISKDQTGWEAEYALYFLENGKGNCYNFSATYCLLCRELGLPAYVAVGSVLNTPHGWVEIVLDGDVYMFDTQLEWRYLHQYKKTGYDLFKMSPDNTPFRYTW